MRRRRFLCAAGALTLSLPAFGQRQTPKIGYLMLVPLSDSPSRERQGFLDGLRANGYVPGANVEVIYASAQNAPEFLDDVCQDLLAQKIDIIVTSGSLSALAAQRCTRTVPIVIQALGDPVAIGVVRSLSRPEGNITGVSFLSTDLAPKRVEITRELIPSVRRIAVLWNAANPDARFEAEATVGAIQGVGLTAERLAVQSDAELRNVLGQLKARKPDALYAAFSDVVGANRTAIAQAALEAGVPIVSGYAFLTEAGGLVSYAPDIPAMFRYSATYVRRILKGSKPSELPIELARDVELIVNLRTAKALGITIPQSFLVRADRVIA